MAYRRGNREQLMMFPQSVEDFVSQNHPARVYDAFVEGLDFDKLNFKMNGFNKVGNPEYDPKSLLKVILYGYSYGERSSRRLERAINDNIIFIWLSGGLKPDHVTIARFRKRNSKLLKKIFKQCAQLCIKLKLIEGNTLFVDGTKIRANAGLKNIRSKQFCKKYDQELEQRIREILKECDKADKREQNMSSFVYELNEELNTKHKIKEKIEKALSEIEAEDLEEVNITDPEARKMKGRQGTHLSYNAQVVVDEKHGLIVSNDVVNDVNDLRQFGNQINQAHEILEKKCNVACADAGYSGTAAVKTILEQVIEVVVPNQQQALHDKKETGFEKKYFKYDEKADEYICPTGKRLKLSYKDKKRYEQLKYQIAKRQDCFCCQHYGICTVNKRGRAIGRHKDEKIIENLAKIYESDKGQEIYKKRQARVELVFGHIKHNLRITNFMLRGLDAAQSEMNIFSTVFNLTRLINLIGTKPLIEKMAALKKQGAIFDHFSCFKIIFTEFLNLNSLFKFPHKKSMHIFNPIFNSI